MSLLVMMDNTIFMFFSDAKIDRNGRLYKSLLKVNKCYFQTP